MTLHARDAASWKVSAPYVRSGGAWVLALSVSARDAGSWKTVAQILSAVSITGTTAVANGVTINLGTTVTGGYGTLTYLWSKVTGTGTISGSTTNPTVSITPTNNNVESEFQVVVTDSLTGTVASKSVVVTWGTPP